MKPLQTASLPRAVSAAGPSVWALYCKRKGIFHLGKSPVNLNLLCSIDSLKLQGEGENSKERKETLLFYGLGLSMDF